MADSPPNRFERQEELIPRRRILEESATVIGVGAIGRQVAWQLTALGIPQLQVIDFDHVEPVNVTSQGFRADDVGRPKVDAVGDACFQIEPQLDFEGICDRFRPALAVGTSVFCCVDAISTRAAIWRALESRCRFWADGRMLGETVRVLIAADDVGRRHYPTTLFPQSEAQSGRCTQRSTIYGASLAAALLVHQFSRYLRGVPTDADATFNLLAGEYVLSATP